MRLPNLAHGWLSLVLSSAQTVPPLQDTIKLTRKQQLRAKSIWRQYCKEQAEAEHHHQYILHGFENSGTMIPA